MQASWQTLQRNLEHLREDAATTDDAEAKAGILARISVMENLLRERMANQQPVRWLACGHCHGIGTLTEYEDHWTCPGCNGYGGNWI